MNITIIPFLQPVSGNFLVDIINWLVSISSVAVGIILFTLILKIITLPFDFFSRASMRKNSLKMEEMRPELEKLQKQYANDKNLYNQKMMALYKKNGYSMWGACLPTILTLIIFIVAMNGFSAFSQFQNRKYVYNMSVSYNTVIYEGIETDGNYIKLDDTGKLVFDDEGLYTLSTPYTPDGKDFAINVDKQTTVTGEIMTVKTTNGYISYNVTVGQDDGGNRTFSARQFKTVTENVINPAESMIKDSNNQFKDGQGRTYAEFVASEPKDKDDIVITDQDKLANIFVTNICREMSAKTFRKEKVAFLWVKNIWVKDSPLDHPIQQNWTTFQAEQGYPALNTTETMNQELYNELIYNLDAEKAQPNGFFVLAILTAAISFLTQFIMNKTQKAQMELQTVDGRGASTSKMMMWMMPIMMAIFSFLYTATFSIYMIMSSVISIITTLVINKIIDVKYKKAKKEENSEVVRGRVYVPKQEEVKEEKKNKKKDKKEKTEKNKGDFMDDAKVVKHVRGRIK